VLFRCKWWDLGHPRNIIEYGNMKSIKCTKTWYRHEPFVLATHAKQVFYLEDRQLGRQWRVVQKFDHRHIYNIIESSSEATRLTDVEALLAEEVPICADSDVENDEFFPPVCDTDITIGRRQCDDDEDVVVTEQELQSDSSGDNSSNPSD
jgi:hypothetical protein